MPASIILMKYPLKRRRGGRRKAMASGLAVAGTGKNLHRAVSAGASSIADSLFDNVSVGVIFTNTAGFLTHMNRKAETILQIDKRAVLGKRIDMLPLKTPIYKAMSENCRDYPLEISILGRGIVIRSSEVITADGTVLGEITELYDITAERKEKRQREEFVAMMTHDLKAPLMVMLGHVQAIKLGMWGAVDAQIKTSIEEIERSGLNISSMLEDVLDIYRVEMGLLHIRKSSCDVVEILGNCCSDGRLHANEKGIELSLCLNANLPLMFADGRQLARVFNNLIGNAVKFTQRKGEVSVTAAMRDGLLHVSVRDTGIGIPENDIPLVFNKYFRSSKASGFKGTGLGLTISRSIVEAHGGLIEVESVEGAGSIFTVKIPVESCDVQHSTFNVRKNEINNGI
jgi:signal transduction histidine kinase